MCVSDWKHIRSATDGKFIASVVYKPTMKNKIKESADAERIVTCVNSCAGIPDPAAAIQAVKGILANLYNDTEGYADGALDASAHDKLCNYVAHHVKAALTLLTPKP